MISEEEINVDRINIIFITSSIVAAYLVPGNRNHRLAMEQKKEYV